MAISISFSFRRFQEASLSYVRVTNDAKANLINTLFLLLAAIVAAPRAAPPTALDVPGLMLIPKHILLLMNKYREYADMSKRQSAQTGQPVGRNSI